MALEVAAQKVAEKRPGPRCGFGRILKTLTPDDLAFYEQMVAEARTGSFITEVFKADGHDISSYTVRRHLSGECACR